MTDTIRRATVGDTVLVDKATSAFHGRVGRVNLLDLPRRPKGWPWIRVQLEEPPLLPAGFEAGVMFTADELVVLGQ